MENNSTCLISSLAILSPCLFAITAADAASVNHSVTEAQSELVRVRNSPWYEGFSQIKRLLAHCSCAFAQTLIKNRCQNRSMTLCSCFSTRWNTQRVYNYHRINDWPSVCWRLKLFDRRHLRELLSIRAYPKRILRRVQGLCYWSISLALDF